MKVNEHEARVESRLQAIALDLSECDDPYLSAEQNEIDLHWEAHHVIDMSMSRRCIGHCDTYCTLDDPLGEHCPGID